MLYKLAALPFPLLFAAEASVGAGAYVRAPDAKGELLECWKTTSARLGACWPNLMMDRFAGFSSLPHFKSLAIT